MISISNRNLGATYQHYYSLSTVFIVGGNALSQVEVNKNKDILSSHSSSDSPLIATMEPGRKPIKKATQEKGRKKRNVNLLHRTCKVEQEIH